MHAAGENHVVTLSDQLAHPAISRQRCRNGKEELHVTRGGFCQHIVHVFMQGFIIQAIKMAVGVD